MFLPHRWLHTARKAFSCPGKQLGALLACRLPGISFRSSLREFAKKISHRVFYVIFFQVCMFDAARQETVFPRQCCVKVWEVTVMSLGGCELVRSVLSLQVELECENTHWLHRLWPFQHNHSQNSQLQIYLLRNGRVTHGFATWQYDSFLDF